MSRVPVTFAAAEEIHKRRSDGLCESQAQTRDDEQYRGCDYPVPSPVPTIGRVGYRPDERLRDESRDRASEPYQGGQLSRETEREKVRGTVA